MLIIVKLTPSDKEILTKAGIKPTWRHNRALEEIISDDLTPKGDKLLAKYIKESKDLPPLPEEEEVLSRIPDDGEEPEE